MFERHAGSVLLAAALAAAPSAAEPIHGTVTTRDGRHLAGTLRWDRNECHWDDFLDSTTVAVVDGDGRGFRFRMFGVKLVDTTRTRQRGVRVAFGHLRSLEATDDRTARLVLKSGEIIEADADSTTDLGPQLRGVELLDEQGRVIQLGWHEIAKVDFGTPPAPRSKGFGPRLHGTVSTMGGAFTGFLAWDKESVLATDPIPFLESPSSDGASRPFADLRAVERFGGGRARLKFTDGTTAASTERRPASVVEIAVPGLGRVSVPWEAVRQVQFTTPPPTPTYAEFDGGRPLAGRVVLTDGSVRSGRIVWDDDETSTAAALEASVDGIEYSITFSQIAAVSRLADASRVRLIDGREIVLRGTNDVDDSNRGIGIVTEGGESEVVEWGRVATVEFGAPE